VAGTAAHAQRPGAQRHDGGDLRPGAAGRSRRRHGARPDRPTPRAAVHTDRVHGNQRRPGGRRRNRHGQPVVAVPRRATDRYGQRPGRSGAAGIHSRFGRPSTHRRSDRPVRGGTERITSNRPSRRRRIPGHLGRGTMLHIQRSSLPTRNSGVTRPPTPLRPGTTNARTDPRTRRSPDRTELRMATPTNPRGTAHSSGIGNAVQPRRNGPTTGNKNLPPRRSRLRNDERDIRPRRTRRRTSSRIPGSRPNRTHSTHTGGRHRSSHPADGRSTNRAATHGRHGGNRFRIDLVDSAGEHTGPTTIRSRNTRPGHGRMEHGTPRNEPSNSTGNRNNRRRPRPPRGLRRSGSVPTGSDGSRLEGAPSMTLHPPKLSSVDREVPTQVQATSPAKETKAVGNSAESPMGAPQFASATGRVSDEGRQLGPVGYRKRNVGATTATGWSTVCLDRKAPIRQKPNVECHQHELLITPGIRPTKRLRNRDVDGQCTHLRDAAHGRMVAQAVTRPHTAPGHPRVDDRRVQDAGIFAGKSGSRLAFQVFVRCQVVASHGFDRHDQSVVLAQVAHECGEARMPRRTRHSSTNSDSRSRSGRPTSGPATCT
jgi:hypothetical protein